MLSFFFEIKGRIAATSYKKKKQSYITRRTEHHHHTNNAPNKTLHHHKLEEGVKEAAANCIVIARLEPDSSSACLAGRSRLG